MYFIRSPKLSVKELLGSTFSEPELTSATSASVPKHHLFGPLAPSYGPHTSSESILVDCLRAKIYPLSAPCLAQEVTPKETAAKPLPLPHPHLPPCGALCGSTVSLRGYSSCSGGQTAALLLTVCRVSPGSSTGCALLQWTLVVRPEGRAGQQQSADQGLEDPAAFVWRTYSCRRVTLEKTSPTWWCKIKTFLCALGKIEGGGQLVNQRLLP